MSGAHYRLVRFADEHDLATFDCGEKSFNEWLTGSAAQAVRSGTAGVWLLLEESSARVVGYFAICPTLVVRDDAPKPVQRRLLRHAPGWLLAKLALDTSMRGDSHHQWGRQLLREALDTIVDLASAGGGQVIVVDADNPSLVPWYERNGFRRAQENGLRLYLKVATARRNLSEHAPHG